MFRGEKKLFLPSCWIDWTDEYNGKLWNAWDVPFIVNLSPDKENLTIRTLSTSREFSGQWYYKRKHPLLVNEYVTDADNEWADYGSPDWKMARVRSARLKKEVY